VYALVIHHGLMNLLHKYTKLVVAAHDPSQVVYCNRKDPASLTPAELLGWADELGPNYLATGATRGVMLKLSDRAMTAVSPIVRLAETFVLGHEAGHYLAGHLEDDTRFSADEEVPWLEVFAENERHEDEFEADAYGFEIMKACSPSAPAETVHAALVGAFSMMGLIGGDVATASHPASSKRYQRMAERIGLPSTA
jgi:Zn-dependent protease with chaperone function